MEAPDVYRAAKAERAKGRRLYELRETQGWVHHVADLDSGEVLTTPLERPLTPLSRAERLSQLGHRFDPTVFGWPSQRLTPRQPHQASPEAWLVGATGPSLYSARYDTIWWEPPREFEDPHAFSFYCVFSTAPAGRSVVSVRLEGQAFPNIRGFVHFTAFWAEGPASFSIPVDGFFAEQTVDFTLVLPAAPGPLEIVVDFREGIRTMVFTGISLGPEPPWVEPGPADPG
jgi:hypothetical protein